MGEVKEAVKGAGLKGDLGIGRKSKVAGSNLVEMFVSLTAEVSRLTAIKDADVLDEGPEKLVENTVKAARLRGVHTLLTSAKTLLEDY